MLVRDASQTLAVLDLVNGLEGIILKAFFGKDEGLADIRERMSGRRGIRAIETVGEIGVIQFSAHRQEIAGGDFGVGIGQQLSRRRRRGKARRTNRRRRRDGRDQQPGRGRCTARCTA